MSFVTLSFLSIWIYLIFFLIFMLPFLISVSRINAGKTQDTREIFDRKKDYILQTLLSFKISTRGTSVSVNER